MGGAWWNIPSAYLHLAVGVERRPPSGVVGTQVVLSSLSRSLYPSLSLACSRCPRAPCEDTCMSYEEEDTCII